MQIGKTLTNYHKILLLVITSGFTVYMWVTEEKENVKAQLQPTPTCINGTHTNSTQLQHNKENVPPNNGHPTSTGKNIMNMTHNKVLMHLDTYSGVKRKHCRCCPACLRNDCGQCRYCLDKPKFGGRGTLKQCCIERRYEKNKV